MLLSILSHYVPDISDFLLLVISILLTVISLYSRQQVRKMDRFMTQNTVDHLNMERRQIKNEQWIKSVHQFEIEPTIKKVAQNEKDIVDIRGDLRAHGGRLKKIEEKKEGVL